MSGAVTVPHYRDMRNPLRKVERQVMYDVLGNGTPIVQDLLECGHLLPPAEDIYGVRWPARRRCCKCRLGMPPDGQAVCGCRTPNECCAPGLPGCRGLVAPQDEGNRRGRPGRSWERHGDYDG